MDSPSAPQKKALISTPHKFIIFFRQALQIFIITLLILSPLLQIVRTFRQDPYPYLESPVTQNKTAQKFLLKYDHSIRDALDPVYSDISGGPYAINIFGVHFLEPLTMTVNFLSRIFEPQTWGLVFMVTSVLVLFLALIFGRVYCGYICPMSLIASLNQKLQRKLFKRTVSYKTKSNLYYITFISIFIIMFPLALQYLLPPALMQHAISDYILFGGLSLWAVILFLVLVFELILPGFYCQKLCPTGLFLSFIGLFSPVRLHFKKNVKCDKHCMLCLDNCWLGLKPKTVLNDPSCDLCHRCVSVCPVNRLTTGLKTNNEKNKIVKKTSVILLFLIFLQPLNLKAGQWDLDDYFETMVTSTLLAGEINYKNRPEQKLNYSFVSSLASRRAGGKVDFYVHIVTKDNVIFFNGPVTITIHQGGELLTSESLENVNSPISITKASVYNASFQYKHNKSYLINFKAPELGINENILFRYPKARF